MSASGPRLSLQHPPTYVPHTTPFSAPQTSASARCSASHPANALDPSPRTRTRQWRGTLVLISRARRVRYRSVGRVRTPKLEGSSRLDDAAGRHEIARPVDASPQAVVIAGPNGAGITSAAPHLLRDAVGIDAFVNADVIAQGLAGFSPQSAAFEAGRVSCVSSPASARILPSRALSPIFGLIDS